MLIKPNSIVSTQKSGEEIESSPVLIEKNGKTRFVNSPDKLHTVLGKLTKGETIHFWSKGTFNSVRLLFSILDQVGPADVMLSTYSISEKSVAQILRRKEAGQIRNIQFLIDNRVRSLSPKPYQALVGSFPDCVRTMSIHAKVTVIKSDDWCVSIISSMNATDNNKIERGIISTDASVFEFDKMVLCDVFKS